MLTDSPTAVLDRPTDSTEQTTQLFLAPWQWPLTDPDDVLDEARAALRHPTEPDLPILEAVLAGLYRLAA